jgi:hypothetical protein
MLLNFPDSSRQSSARAPYYTIKTPHIAGALRCKRPRKIACPQSNNPSPIRTARLRSLVRQSTKSSGVMILPKHHFAAPIPYGFV